MTPPRQILPDQNFEICSRTFARTFRLLPKPAITNLFLYILGIAAKRYGITLYGLVVMVTHYHLTGKDLWGRLPEFAQYFNSLFARALNAYQGMEDKLWSGDGYHLLRPQSEGDLVARMVYIIANPVAADLVDCAAEFPGLIIRPDDIGKTITARRPEFFFRDDGTMPDSIDLTFEVPAEFEHLGRDGYVKLLKDQLKARECEHRRERVAAGRNVMGAQRCRNASLGRRSSSFERWFQLRPTIAARVKLERIEATKALESFHDQYRVALAMWRDGVRDALFPPGTWWMCRFCGAAVG